MPGLSESLPLFLPGIVVWTVLGLLTAAPLGRFLATSREVAFGLTMSFGLIVFATLSPNAPSDTAGICDLSRIGLASLSTLTSDPDALLNVILFVPLGLMLGLLPRTRRNVAIVLAAFSLTFLIEATQLLVTDLGRGCESADMADNTMGLVIGLVAGVVASVATRRPS